MRKAATASNRAPAVHWVVGFCRRQPAASARPARRASRARRCLSWPAALRQKPSPKAPAASSPKATPRSQA
ncbi:hypothetical protein DDQ68_03005 [Hymenobacter nivis]|uniref:Uncharacterized protein n=1 Tax=Hymenobacter nivis TaxID=1850093 RepID=A0A2Z3GR20_9BACT|nr:hypothetical protein DDQ68_03005 [Hymenobacter nivis]